MFRFISFCRNLLSRRRVERQLDDELRATVEMLVDEKVAAGMSVEAARRAARLELGSAESIKEGVRDIRAGAFLETLLQDARYGARLLRRNPLFALTAILSLAIGIGATTTIFTVANGLLLRSVVGVADPSGLVDIVRLEVGDFGVEPVSYPDYLDVRRRATTLEGVYGYHLELEPVSLRTDDSAERAFASVVTTNFFQALGVPAAAGRTFGAGDSDQPGASPITVLSHRFWTRRFAGDPTIVGRTVRLNGHPFTVVGVAREGFRGMSVLAPDLWIPAGMVGVAQVPGVAGACQPRAGAGKHELRRRDRPRRDAADGATAFALSSDADRLRIFSTLRIPLVAGRDFGPDDRTAGERVAILGEATANRFWPGKSAVGQFIVVTTAAMDGSTPVHAGEVRRCRRGCETGRAAAATCHWRLRPPAAAIRSAGDGAHRDASDRRALPAICTCSSRHRIRIFRFLMRNAREPAEWTGRKCSFASARPWPGAWAAATSRFAVLQGLARWTPFAESDDPECLEYRLRRMTRFLTLGSLPCRAHWPGSPWGRPERRTASGCPAGGSEPLPAFEVASVRVNKTAQMNRLFRPQPGGRFEAPNLRLRDSVQFAYQVRNFQIEGGPDWMDTTSFDIVAKAPGEVAPTAPGGPPSRYALMLRTLLADRFKLVVHQETKEVPIYVLALARADGRLGPRTGTVDHRLRGAGQGGRRWCAAPGRPG